MMRRRIFDIGGIVGKAGRGVKENEIRDLCIHPGMPYL
jgi:hypothetical protein